MRVNKATYDRMPGRLQRLFNRMPNPGRDEVVRGFPETKSGNRSGEYNNGSFSSGVVSRMLIGDSGSASRFFYCAKASRSEREAGLSGEAVPCGMMEDDNYLIKTGSGNLRDTKRINHHPTVKPIALMSYLCRLVTPPGGLVLDPFCGSGSTGCAAVQEGFSFIGIELEPEYAEIAKKRIDYFKNNPAPAGKKGSSKKRAAQKKPSKSIW